MAAIENLKLMLIPRTFGAAGMNAAIGSHQLGPRFRDGNDAPSFPFSSLPQSIIVPI